MSVERIPILKMGQFLLVSIQVDMHDRLALQLQDDLTTRIAETGAHGVLIDISALKLYERTLQLTLENAGSGIIRYDAEGRVLLFNRQALHLLDLPVEVLRLVTKEVSGNSFPNPSHPGSNPMRADHPYQRPDGARAHLQHTL